MIHVARTQLAAEYESVAPFHPAEAYPELKRARLDAQQPSNRVYSAVRELFLKLRLDHANAGTPFWNPLRDYVRRDGSVVIKPNFVTHEYSVQLGRNCITTHGSVLRPVIDYCYLAAGNRGRITIADAPVQSADFEKLVKDNGITSIRDYYRDELGFELEIVDLRQTRAIIDEGSGLITADVLLPGDPRGYDTVDIGTHSTLSALDHAQPSYVVGDYSTRETNRRHGTGHHEYVVSRTVLDADAIVFVPKLKTHSKVGLTVCLKNVIGIIGSKDCLPHHRKGSAASGGDEFPRSYPMRWYVASRVHQLMQGRVPTVLWRAARSAAQKLLGAGTPASEPGANSVRFFSSGSWRGNDTIWRTVDDLNRILFFWNTQSRRFDQQPQRKYFAVVDGVISMEGNGPLKGTPRKTGILLASGDPLAIDVVAAEAIGIRWPEINMLAGIARGTQTYRYTGFTGDDDDIRVVDEHELSLSEIRDSAPHVLPAGWRDNSAHE